MKKRTLNEEIKSELNSIANRIGETWDYFDLDDNSKYLRIIFSHSDLAGRSSTIVLPKKLCNIVMRIILPALRNANVDDYAENEYK